MIVYIIQNEQDDIWFVSSNPVETLEELERGGKQVISVTCWSIDEEKEFSFENNMLKVHSTVDTEKGINSCKQTKDSKLEVESDVKHLNVDTFCSYPQYKCSECPGKQDCKAYTKKTLTNE